MSENSVSVDGDRLRTLLARWLDWQSGLQEFAPDGLCEETESALAGSSVAPQDQTGIVAKVRLIVARFRSLGAVPELCDLAWQLCNENERLREVESTPSVSTAVAPQDQWQPIATAPKDRWVLLFGEGWLSPNKGVWSRASNCWVDSDGGFQKVTHWMPLPAPPLEGQATPPVSPAIIKAAAQKSALFVHVPHNEHDLEHPDIDGPVVSTQKEPS